MDDVLYWLTLAMWWSYSIATGIDDSACKKETRPQRLTSPDYLSSPGFGNMSYPANTKCSWHLAVPEYCQGVTVTFHSFRLEDELPNCIHDCLTLSGNNKTMSLCGYIRPGERYSFSGRNLNVTFLSDFFSQYPGFLLKFEWYACGGMESTMDGYSVPGQAESLIVDTSVIQLQPQNGSASTSGYFLTYFLLVTTAVYALCLIQMIRINH